MRRRLTTALATLALAGAAGLDATPARAGSHMVYGISDANFATLWPMMESRIAPLRTADPGFQVAVWTRWNGSEFNPIGLIPRSQPVLAILYGGPSPFDDDRSSRAFAAAARSFVLANPNVREVQVWNQEIWADRSPGVTGTTSSTTPIASADSELRTLARTYDAVHPTGVLVLAPGAHPSLGNQLAFVRAVRDYYARSKRRRPLTDGYAVHPYWNFSRRSTSMVARAMNRAWRGLPQRSPSSGLRFWWTETGMESDSPTGVGYFGTPNYWWPSLHMLGTAADQANRVATVALKARANPIVAADFNFELGDSANLSDWQSGLYYLGGSPKPAFYSYETAIALAQGR
jgi:hypothetical protein